MKLCFHNILHIADSIEHTGPCWATWQFPMEQMCGMLLSLARSHLHPYKNIINNVHIWEMFNHLQFDNTIYLTIFPPQQAKNYADHLVFSLPGADEEFHFPSKKHILSRTELKKIKDHFSVLYNVNNRKLKVIIYFFYYLQIVMTNNYYF